MSRAAAFRLSVIVFVAVYPLQLLLTLMCSWWLGSPWWGLLTTPATVPVAWRIYRWGRR